MINKKKLVAKFVKKPINLFDMVNYSARFEHEMEVFFDGTKCFNDRFDLHEYVAELVGGKPVTYLEFGVWQGATFRKWLELNEHPDSRFHGFDSFEGLPEDWVKGQPKGTFSTGGRVPEISDPRGTFEIGWFQKTLYTFLDDFKSNAQLVLHVDCDLYSSTLFVLTSIDRHMPPGTIIIFDDFSSIQHEFAAWLDYRRSFNRQWEALGHTPFGVQGAVRLIS